MLANTGSAKSTRCLDSLHYVSLAVASGVSQIIGEKMDTQENIVKTIMRTMPEKAEHYLIDKGSSGYILSIFWKLNNDENRPNKPSKSIVIPISRELIDDFPAFPESLQNSALKNIEKWSMSMLEQHDPDHNEPKYAPAPSVQWYIPVDQLFG